MSGDFEVQGYAYNEGMEKTDFHQLLNRTEDKQGVVNVTDRNLVTGKPITDQLRWRDRGYTYHSGATGQTLDVSVVGCEKPNDHHRAELRPADAKGQYVIIQQYAGRAITGKPLDLEDSCRIQPDQVFCVSRARGSGMGGVWVPYRSMIQTRMK